MQTSYSQYGAAAMAGMLFDLSDYDSDSFSAQGVISPSVPVTRGADPANQCVMQTGAAGQAALCFGFAMLKSDMEHPLGGSLIQYADKETVPVMRRGKLWVNTNNAVTAGNVANLHLATGKLTDAGVAAGIEAFTQMRVRFITSTAAAGLAAVEISKV